MARKRIVVFASGRGSNAEAIYEASRNGTVNGDVVMVFSDRSQAAVLRKAASWGCLLLLPIQADFHQGKHMMRRCFGRCCLTGRILYALQGI